MPIEGYLVKKGVMFLALVVMLANGICGDCCMNSTPITDCSIALQSDEIWHKSNFTLNVGGDDVLIIRTDVEYFIETRFPGLYDNGSVQSFVERNRDCLTYVRRTPAMTSEEAILLTACNKTYFSELLVKCTFNETNDIADILSASVISRGGPIDSLRSCLGSVMEKNQTMDLRVTSWTSPFDGEMAPVVGYLWSYNYTGASLWFGDAYDVIWSHNHADSMLTDLHWEIATRRYVEQVVSFLPFKTVTRTAELVLSVTPSGEVIQVRTGSPPPLDGASILPVVLVGGTVLAVVCIALVFRWARGRR
jgi:hypothetical protein